MPEARGDKHQSNQSISQIVQDVNLEDVRPGSREIKHLIQRKTRSMVLQDSALVKVVFRKDVAGKKGTTSKTCLQYFAIHLVITLITGGFLSK